MNKYSRLFAAFVLALALVFSSFSLAGCSGGGADEQDNCYGEDMPVVNE